MTQTTTRIASAIFAAALVVTLVGCTPDATAPSAPVSPPSASSAPDAGDGSAATGPVSMEQAGTVATDKYGGTIKSIEDDSYKGEPAWEVELRDSTQGRIEVKVSKATGEILAFEQDH